ncbi:MAG: DNA polymerase III subunit alpha [Candidatus Caenarcaniphilales bacterium]|nr:DNA polymerase III subunit alpha [Candidatus Caenarcaniphilales bacterium]
MSDIATIPHVPLHVHTEYSLLDGASRIPELVSRAKELGMPALGISDHGVMFGCFELFQECKKQGIKPIIGSEVYVINGDHTDKSTRLPLYHLVLLAKNDKGYKNLTEIVSEANANGFYYKPRISKEYLRERAEGLVCLTACLGGEVPNNLMSGKYDEAKKAALFYQELFGEDFYLEMQDHGIAEEARVNSQMEKLAKEINCKIVITNDSHYTKREDAIAHDAILCLQTNKTITDFPRMHFSGTEYLKGGGELEKAFIQIDNRKLIREAIEETSLEIMEKIESYPTLENTQPRMPQAPVPDGETNESYLRKLCYARAEEKYGELNEQVLERMDYELKIIEDSGFAGYFLIVADFISFARKEKIPVGPGRGSAAGSLVAYALGITNIDPLRFNLLFERFLNPERKSMPDIDTDFCIERRGEVIEYVRKLYGEDKVAQIITFNRLTSKAVVKDVARVMSYPYQKAETLAKAIPVVRGKPRKLDWMIENHPEFKKIYDTDQTAQEVVNLAKKIEGTNKTFGVHAAGVIIGDVSLTDVVPLAKSKEGGIITQYSMDHMATLGLLKMDFLGLRNLTMIHRAIDIIAQTTGNPRIDIDEVSLEDPKVYELLSKGDLAGVFQLETSSGMKQVARDMKPSSIDDISAIIALYRPGPLDTGMIDEFIDRKHGRKKIEYKTPELESILKDTYGTIVYQEQIMQIAQKLAGFTLGQADLLRRAMGKKKPEEMNKYKQIFMDGTKERGINQKVAEELFEMMMAFAEYCFNKSHSAAYAMISYQTAWLKANYPVQYLTALMSSVSSDQDKVRFYIAEAQRMGINILPPDINISGFDFTAKPDDQQILFGMAAVKNVGENAIEEIIRARDETDEFESLEDLCRQVDLKAVNRRALESLILCGAFANVSSSTRKGLLESLDSAISKAQKEKERAAIGQTSLFGSLLGSSKNNDNSIQANDINNGIQLVEKNINSEEFSEEEIQKLEKDILGFYVTSHPLAGLSNKLSYFSTHTLSELSEAKDGSEVIVPVLISQLTKRMTKTNKLIGIGVVEDLQAKVEAVFFSRVLEESEGLLHEDNKVLLKAKVQVKSEGEVSLMASSVREIKDLSYLEVTLSEKSAQKKDIDWQGWMIGFRNILKKYAGATPVVIKINEKEALVDSKLWVTQTDLLIDELNSNDFLESQYCPLAV